MKESITQITLNLDRTVAIHVTRAQLLEAWLALTSV